MLDLYSYIELKCMYLIGYIDTDTWIEELENHFCDTTSTSSWFVNLIYYKFRIVILIAFPTDLLVLVCSQVWALSKWAG